MSTALLSLGFRVFFLGAGVFSVISIALWLLIYTFDIPLQLNDVSMSQWHAHEMILWVCAGCDCRIFVDGC